MANSVCRTSNDNRAYVLPVGRQDAERLDFQSQLLQDQMRIHLSKAGLSVGQIVWDIGCGNGAVTEYLAQTVGETGHIYAFDISEQQLEEVKQRILKAGLNNVTFLCGDICALQDDWPKEGAHIIHGRFVLMHLQNPKLAIQNMKALLKPGGVVASHEVIRSTACCAPDASLLQDLTDAVVALGKARGVDYDIGAHVADLYQESGYDVDIYNAKLNLSVPEVQKLLTMDIHAWSGAAIEAGVATSEQVQTWLETISQFPLEDHNFCFHPAKQVYVLAKKL